MRPQRNAGGARSTPPASHDETRLDSIDLPPAMAALGGDYIAELAVSDPMSLGRALERLAAAAKATAHRASAWRLWRRDYQAQAKRLRAERLRDGFARGPEPTASASSPRTFTEAAR